MNKKENVIQKVSSTVNIRSFFTHIGFCSFKFFPHGVMRFKKLSGIADMEVADKLIYAGCFHIA
jgi:hypothetical protein